MGRDGDSLNSKERNRHKSCKERRDTNIHNFCVSGFAKQHTHNLQTYFRYTQNLRKHRFTSEDAYTGVSGYPTGDFSCVRLICFLSHLRSTE